MKTPAQSFIVEVKRKYRIPPDHSPLLATRNGSRAAEKITPLSTSRSASNEPVRSLKGDRNLLHLQIPAAK